jgi:hypothetical protein
MMTVDAASGEMKDKKDRVAALYKALPKSKRSFALRLIALIRDKKLHHSDHLV